MVSPCLALEENVHKGKPKKSSEAGLCSLSKVVKNHPKQKHLKGEMTEIQKTYQDIWHLVMFLDYQEEGE